MNNENFKIMKWKYLCKYYNDEMKKKWWYKKRTNKLLFLKQTINITITHIIIIKISPSFS